MMNENRILYVANVAWFFRSHRLPLALEAIRRGYEVHLASAFRDPDERREFESMKIITHDLPFERSGTALLTEIATIARLGRLYVRLRPSLSHNVSIKPVIYGGLLCRALGINAVNAISGLGFSYIAQGLKAYLRRAMLNFAYSSAVKGRCSRVVVQNEDDRDFFKRELGVSAKQLIMIKGSGVDLPLFDPNRPSAMPSLVVLPARMLVDKGLLEFVEAARILKSKGHTARFALVGGLDPENPAGLSQQQIDELTSDGAVEHWGHRSDIPEVLAAAKIVCLPSYREGLPKVLLEAAAAGRAIVTTDVPGCREVVRQGDNGLLVPPRDATALSNALEVLLKDTERCSQMGRRGRAIVEEQFSLERVVDQTMKVYEDILR
jgi:glycosyltransferase involved in cell wall biosynthesis